MVNNWIVPGLRRQAPSILVEHGPRLAGRKVHVHEVDSFWPNVSCSSGTPKPSMRSMKLPNMAMAADDPFHNVSLRLVRPPSVQFPARARPSRWRERCPCPPPLGRPRCGHVRYHHAVFFSFLSNAAVGRSRICHSFIASYTWCRKTGARIERLGGWQNCKCGRCRKTLVAWPRDDAYMANETRSTGGGSPSAKCPR
jgi:hypothetical protein